jgi:hypothetical protein
LEASGFEPRGFAVCPAGAGELAQRCTPPQLEGLVEYSEPAGRVGFGGNRVDGLLEAVGVHVPGVDVEHIAARTGDQACRFAA